MKMIWKMVPGLAMALVIAAAAKGLEYLEGLAGLHLIGASVLSLIHISGSRSRSVSVSSSSGETRRPAKRCPAAQMPIYGSSRSRKLS